MNDTSFASLSPSLLARKGGARPAMRPQHGGMLGGSAPAADALSSDEELDDLGWNDMGDDAAPQNDADIIKLTPAPTNEQAAAEARDLDEQTGATLAGFTLPQSPARDQQEVLAKRLEKKSPPILSDAIMTDEDCLEDEDFESEEAVADDSISESAIPGSMVSDTVQADEKPDALIVSKRPIPTDEQIVAPTDLTPEIVPELTAAKKTPKPAPVRRVAAVSQGKRAAFTLRLDPERHLKLRLASTIRGRSAQQIVTDALDAYLGDMPDLESLAAQVKRN